LTVGKGIDLKSYL